MEGVERNPKGAPVEYPRPPALIAPYLTILGPELTLAFLLRFGGAPLYDKDMPRGRSSVEVLIGFQRRASRLLTLQPEERYRRFVETRPDVARRVPQYLIASYLGLTPESLSRIRRRIADRSR